MHMADALLSPAVGGTMWAVSAGAIAYCSAKVRKGLDDRKVPLMGVLGAFLFAAQMINFTIPGTGSSGHLGGGLLLSILLGPYAAFLTISSVLMVQALFFADGGLLALGCNIFNMGFIPAFLVYPLIYKRIAGPVPGRKRIVAATMISAIIGLQLGPLGVVLETVFSGISALPFSAFALLMQPIHLAIGVVEGVATVAIVTFVQRARPEIIQEALGARTMDKRPLRTVLAFFLVVALLTGGILSGFASKYPDGLEWAIAGVTGTETLKGPEQGLHAVMTALQKRTAFLPDYSFPKTENRAKGNADDSLGTSVSGVVGGLMTLAIVFLSGFALKRRNIR
ncbi:MAG: energy-coupling factor ABC transporter permease [Oryzomonas sp.]|uniref:energy-coupling factor ABC transporter permease n=1 Tax=Oryzomonas sp. TaxID=2855186 RepID=UPI00284CFD87|nr:energy-coupling factor ABC transporter permease [Oryzomonas sp.]MDR3581019.1 energy-coupling factor ABC transporter permease [Oryzomonas sp.]